MLRKLNLTKTTALVAALAAAGLSAPASVNAQTSCTPAQQQFVIDYCTAYWRQQHFATHAACVAYYMPGCGYSYTYDGALDPDAPVTVRED